MQKSGPNRTISSKGNNDLNKCFLCGLKFALMLAPEREAHINQCLETDSLLRSPAPSADGTSTKTPSKATGEAIFRCPTCDKDLSQYPPTRRGSHTNRCMDEFNSINGLSVDGIDAMRSGLELENGARRKKKTNKLPTEEPEVPADLPPKGPPPRSMNMDDVEYDCVICDKRLPSGLRTRRLHIACCTQEHGIDVEELGKRTEARNARLAQEREAWDAEHSEFTSSQEEAAQLAARRAQESEAPKKRKKSAAAVIGAHLESMDVESALTHFYPSQLLDSQNTSTHSHNLTWGSGSPEKMARSTSLESGFEIADRPPPTSPSRLQQISTANRRSTPIVLDSPLPARSSLVTHETIPLWNESFESLSNTQLDSSLPEHINTRAPKRLSSSDIDDFYPSSIKRAKATASASVFSSSQTNHVILLDSPSVTPSASQDVPVITNGGRQDEDEMMVDTTPMSSQDDTVLKFKKPTEAAKEKESSFSARGDAVGGEKMQSDDYFLLPLEERIRLSRSAPSQEPTTITTNPKPSESNSLPRTQLIENDDDLLLPAFSRTTTPPIPTTDIPSPLQTKKSNRSSGIVDITSPDRPQSVSRFPAPSAQDPSSALNVPENVPRSSHYSSNENQPHASSRSAAIPSRPLTRPSTTSVASSSRGSFESELDGIIQRFHKIEQQARETYFQTLAQTSKNRTHAVLRLATNYSVDVSSAMTTMALRTAELSSNVDAGPLFSPDASIDSEAVLPSPTVPVPARRVSEPIHQVASNSRITVPETVREDRQEQDSIRPKATASSRPTSATNLPLSSSASNIAVTTAPIMAPVSTSTAPRSVESLSTSCPDFDGMSNSELAEKASQFSLSSSVSRVMLVLQLKALWQYQQQPPAPSTAAPNPRPQQPLPQPTPQLSLAERIASYANPLANSSTSISTASSAPHASDTPVAPPPAKRTRAKSTKAVAAAKATASAPQAAIDSPRSSDSDNGGPPTANNGAPNSEANNAPIGATLHEKLENFIRGDIDLYASILHFTSVDIVELQGKLKKAKIKASRSDLQDYLQGKSVLCHNPKKNSKTTAAKSSASTATR